MQQIAAILAIFYHCNFYLQSLHVFLPIIRNIVNASLVNGIFPNDLKHDLVTPILKGKGLDTEQFKNYRPVSTLSFMSKVIEKSALVQVNAYLKENSLIPKSQSAYLADHSCETALCKVVNDVQKLISERKVVLLVQLDLSSAFDTIDHDELLQLLNKKFGFTGAALKFFKSYMSNRTFRVKIKHVKGGKLILIYGVPQGSILGPLLFVLYVSDLPELVSSHDICLHSYADDSQLYVGLDPSTNFSATLQRFHACLDDIQTWMKKNFLKLNVEKTEVLFLARPQDHCVYQQMSIMIGEKCYLSSPADSVRSLGAYLRGDMSMEKMVTECVKSCNFNLLRLKRFRHYLDTDSRKNVIKSYILGKLDYCNILYCNLSRTLISKLDRALRNAVRFIYDLKKNDSISHYMKEAHILPIIFRIQYKACLIVYKIINSRAPDYLNDFIVLNIPSEHNLQSNQDFLKVMPCNTTNTLQFFMTHAWNDLPYDIRSAVAVEIFKTKLKTHYFNLAFPSE